MRWIGHGIHADADLDIDRDTTLADAHRLAHDAEHALTHAVPKLTGAIVHAYPERPGASSRQPAGDTPCQTAPCTGARPWPGPSNSSSTLSQSY